MQKFKSIYEFKGSLLFLRFMKNCVIKFNFIPFVYLQLNLESLDNLVMDDT